MRSEEALHWNVAAHAVAMPDAFEVLESLPDNVFVLDSNWNFTFLNRNALKSAGTDRRILGKNFWAMFPELEHTVFGRAYKTAMATGAATTVYGFYAAARAWYSVDVHPLPDGLALFSRKIPPPETGIAASQRGERYFRSIFETLTQGIVCLDKDGFVLDANPAAAEILGLSIHDMKGRAFSDSRWQILDEDGTPLAAEKNPSWIALRTGLTVRGVILAVLNPAQKEHRWLSVDSVPQFAGQGPEPSHVYTTFTDITEQRTTQKALRDSQAHLARAQRIASVGSSILDFETDRLTWSDETYKIYGQDKACFTPTVEAALNFLHPDDREPFVQRVGAARQGSAIGPVEFRILRPDGEERILHCEFDLIRDNAGEATGLMATHQDITGLRAAEKDRELLQNQLYHAQRLDALGTLAGGIAHDLNNTLVPILGLSEALIKTMPPGDSNRSLLEVIQQAGIRARDLVRQILSFSRDEIPDNRPVDIASLTKETMRLLRASVPTTVTIEEKIDDVPRIFADPSQLHQVILNLVTNAAQALGERVGSISVEVAKCPDDLLDEQHRSLDSFIRISVCDSGSGMDKEVQKRIFEPFYTTKKIGMGTGLGLSVVHGIVRAHGGRIQVSSEPGRGSRFDIFLPSIPRDTSGVAASNNPIGGEP